MKDSDATKSSGGTSDDILAEKKRLLGRSTLIRTSKRRATKDNGGDDILAEKGKLSTRSNLIRTSTRKATQSGDGDDILAEKRRLATRIGHTRASAKKAVGFHEKKGRERGGDDKDVAGNANSGMVRNSDDHDILTEKNRLFGRGESRRSPMKPTSENELKKSNPPSALSLKKMVLSTRRNSGKRNESNPSRTPRPSTKYDNKSSMETKKHVDLKDPKTKLSHPRRYSLDQQPIDASIQSFDSVLDAIGAYHEKSDNPIVIDPIQPREPEITQPQELPPRQRERQQQQQRQQQLLLQPGAVRISGVGYQSDEEGRGRYDNLNDAYSEEFRRASIVQVQIVSDDALEQEVLNRIRQRDVPTLPESLTEDSKTSRTNSSWKRVGILVCVVITIALIGGLVGGILSTQQSDPETPSPSPPFSPRSQAPSSSSPPSSSPTTSPTQYVPEELLELYSMVQIQPDYPFPNDTSSYSYRALEWVQSQRVQHPNITRQEIVEKYVGACLVYVGNAIEIFPIETWGSTGWFTGRSICGWMGITCDYVETSTENSTEDPVVVGILVDTLPFDGTIPPELALLSNSLRELTFDITVFTGTIPTELGLLTKLQKLRLYLNRFTGELPSEIGLLTELKMLNVSANMLTGTVPTEIMNIGSSLEEMDLGYNDLHGELEPAFYRAMTNLQFFQVGGNDLGGSLPSEIGFMTTLCRFRAFDARMGSSLPTEIGLLTDLEELLLGRNVFSGSLPSEMGLLTSLHSLYLFENSFNGTLPFHVFDQLSNLSLLDLSYNELSGTLPEALGFLPKLNNLHVGENRFVGLNPICRREELSNTTRASQEGFNIFADCSELDCPCCTGCCEDGPRCRSIITVPASLVIPP